MNSNDTRQALLDHLQKVRTEMTPEQALDMMRRSLDEQIAYLKRPGTSNLPVFVNVGDLGSVGSGGSMW